jgi:class 3 adenylate cyclase/tetratricopeptide (TPR) repeat protein
MQDPQCQHTNPPGQKFCGECGTRLQAVCSACKAINAPGQKFCGECGARLESAATPAPAAAPPGPTPESYTPKHLAERILTSRAALEGERKQVTVLFADLKGSMELLADRDPEEARAILDPVLGRMMEAVHRYEGTVNQVMGDGIMALFGAPIAHEDHAVRACYAALRMQEAVKQYAQEVQRSEGVPLQIRVGLNSGEVVVRSIGSDLRMDYTAVGQTTHLAARMEQTAMPGSSLLASDTLRLVEGYVRVTALGPMRIKGLGEPVEVYELVGAGTARSRLQAAAARGLTKFVGRDAELDTLRRTLEKAGAGHGQVVALIGEPGVGKSRLVWEVSHSHRSEGWLVLESSAVSYGKATAYLPVVDLLQNYCGIEARDDPRRMRQKVLGKVLDLDRALEPLLPPLLALLDVPGDDPAWQALDPAQRRQRTLDALKRLLLRESQEQPLLLVFEDLHWIDTETQALLDSLVESLPTARVLLLVNYRPEYGHDWHRKTYYRELRLDPLPPASADELLQALLGEDEQLASLKRRLLKRTEGNPFFLEESVRTLVETGALVGARGAYRAAQPLAATQVPATVQAVLAARIDRLASEDKRLLQSAAVVGKDVAYALLQAVADAPEPQLHDGLARLQMAELLYETTLFPELEYTFKHALTHEVAYGSLLQERRRTLHARLVDAIEVLHRDRLAEHVERLAHHSQRAEIWDKAAAYLAQAGTRAGRRLATDDAVAYFEQALDALAHLPPTCEVSERAIDVHLALRAHLQQPGRFEQALEHLRAAERIAEAIGDQRRLGHVSAGLGNYYWSRGDHRGARKACERALAIALATRDVRLQIEVQHVLGRGHHARGDYAAAVASWQEMAALLPDEEGTDFSGLPGRPQPTWQAWAAWSLAELGDFAQAIALGEQAMRPLGTIDHPWTETHVRRTVACMWLVHGDATRAIELLEPALAAAEKWALRGLWPLVAADLGYAYVQMGRTGEALSLLEQVVAQSRSVPAVTHFAEACLLAADHPAAWSAGERALALARHHEERGNEAYVLRLLGAIAAGEDPPAQERAEAYYHQALALAEELGMRPLVAHCRLGVGTLYQKVGRDAEAQAELATAAEMYRAMEMPIWLQKAEAALARRAG